ncbi:MAG: lysostaphin resistance A-like protein [Propionibacteriaceae bacterium]
MTTATTARTLRPPTDPRWPAPVRIILGLVGFLALLLGVTGVVILIGDALGAPEPVIQVSASVAFAASVVGLVAGLARLERRGGKRTRPRSELGPLAQLGLRWSAHDARSLLIAIVIAIAAMVLVAVIGRLTGMARAVDGLDQFSTLQLLGAFAVAVVPAFVMQGFPEELFFRGYVLNAARVRLPVAVATSSLLFGSLHFLSQSPATGVLEKYVLYPLMAVALGFACACARIATGSLWAAVGIHGGMHMGNQVASLFAAPAEYAGQLVVEILVLTAVGLLLWAGRSRLDRPENAAEGVAGCSTVAA